MLRKEIELDKLVDTVYNFTQAQVNYVSIIFLNLLYKRLGHPSIFVMK